MTITLTFTPRVGFSYSCPCGFSGTVPSVYRDAALMEAHLRDCDREAPKAATGPKLDADLVREIRRRGAARERHRDIAAVVGVSPATVSNVIARKVWADVD